MRVMEINPSSPRKALEGCFLSKTRLTIRSFFGRLSEGCWGGAGVGWGGVGWGVTSGMWRVQVQRGCRTMG